MEKPIYNINEDVQKLISVDTSVFKDEGFFKLGYRKHKFLESAIVLGRERDIIFPSGEKNRSFFAIVEMDNIIASHNEENFADSIDYPTNENGRNLNDRNYGKDKNAQAKVMSVAQKLNPNIIVSTNATASGTPIITIDGIVVSGNNRTMSVKRARNNHPEVYDHYKRTLIEELGYGGYGIEDTVRTALMMGDDIIVKGSSFYERKAITIRYPILVRINVDFPEYTTAELNKYNKTTKKSERQIDAAIRISEQLKANQACSQALVNLISTLDVVSELYNKPDYVSKFKKILLDCELITENDIAGLFANKTLTESGKLMYEIVLLSLVLDAKSIEISQNAGIKSFTNNIVNAIIPLVINKSLGDEASLIQQVNNALLVKNDVVNKKYNSLAQYATERPLFDIDDYKTNEAIVLADFIGGKKNTFKDALLTYNNSASTSGGGDMFGDALTPSVIFQKVFTDNIDSKLAKALVLKTKETEKEEIFIEVTPESTDVEVKETIDVEQSDIIKKALKYI